MKKSKLRKVGETSMGKTQHAYPFLDFETRVMGWDRGLSN